MADTVGAALATVSEPDWLWFVGWLRAGPCPRHGADEPSAKLVEVALVRPEDYVGARLPREAQPLYDVLLPSVCVWRSLWDCSHDESQQSAAWSDDQLAAFLAQTFHPTYTPQRLAHEQELLISPQGQRCLGALLAAGL